MINVGQQKLEFDEKLDPYFTETTNKNGATKKLNMSEAGYVKSIEFNIIIKREFYSQNGEPKIWYGLQRMVAKIPNERSFRYLFLYKEPTMQNIAITYFDPTVLDGFGTHAKITSLIDFSDGQYVKKVGSAKKLSVEQLRLKIKNREILGVFKDDLKSQLAI